LLRDPTQVSNNLSNYQSNKEHSKNEFFSLIKLILISSYNIYL